MFPSPFTKDTPLTREWENRKHMIVISFQQTKYPAKIFLCKMFPSPFTKHTPLTREREIRKHMIALSFQWTKYHAKIFLCSEHLFLMWTLEQIEVTRHQYSREYDLKGAHTPKEKRKDFSSSLLHKTHQWRDKERLSFFF